MREGRYSTEGRRDGAIRRGNQLSSGCRDRDIPKGRGNVLLPSG